MKIRRINRTTEDTPDTYTIQVQFSASDIKECMLHYYGVDAIAGQWLNNTADAFEYDFASFLSKMDLQLGKRTQIADWAIKMALKNAYLIPTTGGRYTTNRQLLTMKSGRTSAAVEKLLDS